LAVNPEGVKYVIVRDKALPEPDSILQKLAVPLYTDSEGVRRPYSSGFQRRRWWACETAILNPGQRLLRKGTEFT